MLEDYGWQTPPQGGFSQQLFALAAKTERRQVRTLGFLIGSALLLFVALQNLLLLPLSLPVLHARYQSDALFHDGIDLLVMLCSILLPFLLLSRPMRKVSGCADALPLERSVLGADVALTIPAGLLICMGANIVTDLLLTLLSFFGLSLSSPSLPLPTGVLGVTVSVFRVALMPAVAEELCFRGVVMQHLRRFGDRFALVMSALCFALVHCNLVQAPFAFIVGLALGYFTLQAGTLWPAILIHALNNGVSLLTSYLAQSLTARQLSAVSSGIQNALCCVGAVCLLLYLFRRGKKARLSEPTQTLNGFGAKCGALFSAPPMLIAVALMLYYTSFYVHF